MFEKGGVVPKKEFSGNKYHRTLLSLEGIEVTTDVYRVQDAFQVNDPGMVHALKKILCAGIRGKGDSLQDKQEAIDAIQASIEMEKQRLALLKT